MQHLINTYWHFHVAQWVRAQISMLKYISSNPTSFLFLHAYRHFLHTHTHTHARAHLCACVCVCVWVCMRVVPYASTHSLLYRVQLLALLFRKTFST